MVLLESIEPFADAVRERTKRVTIRLHEARTTREQMEKMKSVLEQSRGRCAVDLVLKLSAGPEAVMGLKRFSVEPNDAMLAGLERVFGERVVELS